MGFNDILKRLFGNKADRDMKELLPIVSKVNAEWEKIKGVSHDELKMCIRDRDKMESFLDLGYPLLVGISRKSMIWRLLEITPQEALNGTTVLNTISLLKGARILRVHDVLEAVEAVKIVEAMKMSS